MNRYKISVYIIALLVSSQFKLMAQNNDEENKLARRLEVTGEKIERMTTELVKGLKEIDTEGIVQQAERIASFSEEQANKIAGKIEGINWEQEGLLIDQENATPINGVEQSKTIQKVYIISKNTPLSINNRYGKVEVKTWTKNEIKVDITIRAIDASGSRAEEIINSVSISETKSPSNISLSTQINKGKSSWWNNIISGNNKGVQINYLISLPKDNSLAINNKYGTVVLPDLAGDVDLDVSYGSLNAGRLSGNNIRVHSSYGSAKILSVKDAMMDFKYGSMDLGEANNIQLNIGYCGGSQIGTLISSGNVDIKYSGGFKIGLDKSIQKLNLDAAYSSSTIRIDPAAHFSYQVDVSYGGFDKGDAVVTKEEPDPSERGPKLHKTYNGYFGKSSSNQVRIDSKYGSITFK
uniref:Adhesin domain-containing protein n=1 Tax=Sphingobacterium sp. (strain 21) TaxID=743722 RepID=F4CD48_SPHS2